MIDKGFVTKLRANSGEITDADFTSIQKEGEIKISDFKSCHPGSKYISTVSDSELILDENSRSKYLATYISDNGKITGLKISKYKKNKEQLVLESGVNLSLKQANVLSDFLQFLKDANLGTLTSGKFILSDALSFDPDLYSKLVALSSDISGRDALIKLFESGYLKLNLDIPELIKKGLSQQKIEEKLLALEEFRKIIENPEVKEVSDIQSFLKINPWIFGPEYKTLDFRDAGFSGNPDGRLLRIDGLSDILEVKLPSEELLRSDNKNRQYISPKLAESLGQLTGYLEYYYSEYSQERNDNDGSEVLDDMFCKYYKPKGILLIGRRNKEMVGCSAQTISAEPKNMRRLLSYFHWIEVLTYDDLIERAENGLKILTSN